MIPRIIAIFAVSLLWCPLRVAAIQSWFNTPSFSNSGADYRVEVGDDASDYIDLFRDQGYVGSGDIWSSPYYPGGNYGSSYRYTYNDVGPAEVFYEATSYDYWAGGQYSSHTVTIGPGNVPAPSVSIDGRQPNDSIVKPYGSNVVVTVRFTATDPNSDLSGILPYAWHQSSGYLNNNGGAYVSQSGGSGEVVWTITLDRDGDWYFWTYARDALNSYSYMPSWTSGFRLNVSTAANQAPNFSLDHVTQVVPNGQTLSLSGWAADPEVGAPINRVEVWVDGVQQGNASLNGDRPDVAAAYGRADYRYSGFGFNTGIVGYAPGTHSVNVRAYDNFGAYVQGDSSFIVPNVAPAVGISILDPGHNALGLDGNGRVRLPVGSQFYIRVSGSDSESRLANFYSRVNNNVGAGYAYEQVAVSGSSGNQDFGPYYANGVGIWDVWGHAQDHDGGWADAGGPDIEVYQPNRPPTVSLTVNGTSSGGGGANSLSISNGATLNFATSAGDPDGNFQRTRIWANYENQGWNEIRNIAAGADSFTYTLTGIGSWQFQSRSLDNDGAESATAVINVTSTNRAPVNLSLNNVAATMLWGSSVALTSGAHDADGNLVHHMFWRRGPRGEDSFSEDWNGWQNYHDDSSGWSSWSSPGNPSNPTNSSISATFTPTSPGYWQFHANGWDAYNASTSGATGNSVFVAPPPSANITVSRSQASVNGGGSITVNVGQTVTIASSASAAGWLSEHNIYGYINGDPGNWFSPSNGGAWLDGADYNTQSNRSVTWQPTTPGTYTFYVEAFTGRSAGERIGGTSGYPGYYDGSASKRVTVTVIGHESPVVNFTLSSTTLYIGQTLALNSQASDVNGDMLLHTFWWDQGNGSRWTSPQFQYHEFEPNDEGWSNISNSDGNVANGGNNTITANWTATLPGVYQFHSNAQDARGGWGNGAEYTITVPNRTPTVSYSILDSAHNPLTPDGNGRVTVPVHGNYYVRVQGSDLDGRLSRLYLRMSNPAGASQNWLDVAVSGANASHDFGPFNSGGTSGVWDVWTHARDLDSVNWDGAPGFNGNNYGWATNGAIDVYSYSGPPPVATVLVDGYTSSGTVPWYVGHAAPVVTVRYRATDADSNLQGIRPQVRTEWQEWVWDEYGGHDETFTYFDDNNGQFVPQAGGNGEVAKTITLDKETDWYFWTHAVDAPGQLVNSGDWGTGFLLKVESRPNPAPSEITINSLPASIKLGEPVNLTSSATDISGNMSNHMFWRRGPHSTGAFTDESWLSYSDAPAQWSNWVTPGQASGPRQSSITATFTPPAPGYWQFHANAWDSMGAWGTGASSGIVFVAPPPAATLQAQIGSRIAASGETLRINSAQSIIVSSTASSQGWLSLHNILGLQNNTPFIPAGGTADLSATAALTESRRYITWTPPTVGTYVFYAEASTGNSSGSRVNNTTTPESGRVTVVVYSAADADSDGIEDYLESQYGLNPNNPADALLDKDGDGLTNVAETNLGRNPEVADTDFGASVGGAMQVSWPSKDTSKTTLVGATAGAVSVDRSGNANYEIPIFTPKGAAGLEPSVSIKYTSGGPNGIVGVGWSISGFSMITRNASNPNLYPSQDSVADDADGDGHDRFFLDGNRLQVVSGTYGDDGSEYRTALETFSKIVYHKPANNTSWFELWTKDGRHITYGNTSDSRAIAGSASSPGAVWGWFANRVDDSLGNYMLIDYVNDNPFLNIPKPKSVKYTGGPNFQPCNIIEFEYVVRPDVFWIDTARSERQSNSRLDKVKVSYLAADTSKTVLRTYQLSYEVSSYTKRSRLKSIQEEGLNGSKLPATEFTWSDDSFGFTEFGSYGLPHAHALLFAGDYNLDGKSDLLEIGLHRERYTRTLRSNGSGLQQAGGIAQLNTDSSFDQGNDNILVGDVTGDGRPDIVFMIYKSEANRRRRFVVQMDGNGGYNMSNVTPGGAGEETVSVTGSGSLINSERLIDMDGSGRLALFIAASKRNTSPRCGYYKLNPSNGLFEWTDLGNDRIYAEDNVHLVSSTSGLPRFKINNAILYYRSSFTSPIVDSGKKTIINGWIENGVLHAPDTIWPVGAPLPANPENSDQCYISYPDKRGTGSYQLNYTWKSSNSEIMFFDVNGDGRDDEIIVASGQSTKLKLATGETILDPFPNGPAWTEKAISLDVNGDGRMDLLIRGDPSKGNNSSGYRILKAVGEGPVADLITSVTNGLGSQTDISYKPLSDASVYQLGSTADPALIPLRPTMSVVSSLTFDGGVAHTGVLDGPAGAGENTSYTLTYAYEGLRSAPYRGLVGFSKIYVTDSRTGIQTRTEFNQTSDLSLVALNGQVKKASAWRGSFLLNESDYTHTTMALNSGLTSFAYVSGSSTKAYAFDSDQSTQGDLLCTSTTSQVMDSWGNVTSVAVEAGFEDRSLVADSLYWPAKTTGGAWISPRLKSVTTTQSMTSNNLTTEVDTLREVYYRDNDDISTNDSSGSDFLPTKLISDALISEPEKRTETVLTYGDARGNLTKVSISGYKNATDTQTREVSYVFDTESGRFPVDVILTAPTSAGGEIAFSTAYSQATGLAQTIIDANDLPRSFTYDDFGRSVSSTGPDSITVRTDLEWTTSSRGVFAKRTTLTSNAGGTAVTVGAPGFAIFDRLGRLTRSGSVDADGYPVWSETVFDSNGRVRGQSNPSRQLSESLVFWTEYGYDAVGRPNASLSPTGSSVSILYSGLTTDYTLTGEYDSNPIVKNKRVTRDPAGRTISILNNLGVGSANERDTINYVYDVLGILAEVDATGAKRVFQNDYRGLTLYSEEPDAGGIYSSYNAFGELYYTKDAKNQETTIDYDILGRVKTKASAEGTTTFSYDVASGKGKGGLASVTAPDAAGGQYVETYQYDTALSRLLSVTMQIAKPSGADSDTFSVVNGYDIHSRLQDVTYSVPGSISQKVGYRYNALGAMREIRDLSHPNLSSGSVLWALAGMNDSGAVETEIYGNGVASWTGYSSTDRTLRHRLVENNDGFLENIRMLTDTFGNFRERQLRAGDPEGTVIRRESYALDLLDRLKEVKVNGLLTQTMSYASNGNILNKSDVGAYEYGSNYHAATNIGGTALQYDSNGNLTHKGGVHVATWTSFDQPKTLSGGGNSSSFRYGSSGNRIQHSISTGDSITYAGSVIEYARKSGAIIPRFRIFGPGGQIAQIAAGTTRQVSFFAGDHLGSIESVTAQSGIAKEAVSFDPWGKRRNADWSTGVPPARTGDVNRGFTGHEMMEHLGLINMNGRVYDPAWGRFLSKDPLISSPVNAQTYNGYSYVANNPVSLIDPSGFQLIGLSSGSGYGNYDFSGLNVYTSGPASGSLSISFSYNSGGSFYGSPVYAPARYRSERFHTSASLEFAPTGYMNLIASSADGSGRSSLASIGYTGGDLYLHDVNNLAEDILGTGAQIGADSLNGVQDSAVGMLNILIQGAASSSYGPPSMNYIQRPVRPTGIPLVSSPVWSNGLFADVGPELHARNRFLGGIGGDLSLGFVRLPFALRGSVPRGFASGGQFDLAVADLRSALARSGIDDAAIGVRGSSVTGVSYRTGRPFGRHSDIDFFVESSQLTQGLKTSRRIPGFVLPKHIHNNFDAIDEWAKFWSEILDRKVDVGGFKPGTVPAGPVIRP